MCMRYLIQRMHVQVLMNTLSFTPIHLHSRCLEVWCTHDIGWHNKSESYALSSLCFPLFSIQYSKTKTTQWVWGFKSILQRCHCMDSPVYFRVLIQSSQCILHLENGDSSTEMKHKEKKWTKFFETLCSFAAFVASHKDSGSPNVPLCGHSWQTPENQSYWAITVSAQKFAKSELTQYP